MRRSDSDAAKKARLRAGEPGIDEVATPASEPADFRQLRQLRELDERLEVEGHRPFLDDLDRDIIDEALSLGYINYYKIGAALGLNRSTVRRRIKRLLDRAGYLQSFAETLLGDRPITPDTPEEGRKSWCTIEALATAYAYYTSPGAIAPKGVLSVEEFHRLNQIQLGRTAARRLLYPPIGLQIQRRGEKVVITGHGTLDSALQEAIRAGKAERIYDPPRCHACGQFVSRRATGRPPKYCSERCRSRHRRRR